jgi:hypothetical protein
MLCLASGRLSTHSRKHGAAVEGAEVIVHLAGTAIGDEDKARRLVQAASRAG